VRETIYADFGIRTTRGLYWQTGIVTAGMLGLVITRGFHGGASLVFVAGDVLWLLGVMAWTVRLLKKLDALGASHAQPTEAMKLLFHCATLIPILGSLPLLLRA
jgi:hypothetical protein